MQNLYKLLFWSCEIMIFILCISILKCGGGFVYRLNNLTDNYMQAMIKLVTLEDKLKTLENTLQSSSKKLSKDVQALGDYVGQSKPKRTSLSSERR